MKARRLNVGAGSTNWPGWLHIDRRPRRPGHVQVDVTKDFPFDDGMFEVAYSERLYEHIPEKLCIPSFREVYRVLMLGGRFRLSLPEGYRGPNALKRPGNEANNRAHGHITFFTCESVVQMLYDAGFEKVVPVRWYDNKKQLYEDSDLLHLTPFPRGRLESLIVDGVKTKES